METRRFKPRVIVVKTKAAPDRSREKYGNQQALQVVQLRKIRPGEETFVNYGNDYSFKLV